MNAIRSSYSTKYKARVVLVALNYISQRAQRASGHNDSWPAPRLRLAALCRRPLSPCSAQETMTIKAARKIRRRDHRGNKWRRWALLIAAPAPLSTQPLRKPVGDNFSSTAGRFSFRPRHSRLSERRHRWAMIFAQIFASLYITVLIIRYVTSNYIRIYALAT